MGGCLFGYFRYDTPYHYGQGPVFPDVVGAETSSILDPTTNAAGFPAKAADVKSHFGLNLVPVTGLVTK